MLSKMNLIPYLLFISLFSCSTANQAKRFADNIQEVSVSNPNSNIWVVLVAGSNGYFNYRHQANVLHAYDLIHNLNKVPKERIILMMYDDIAYSTKNPYKGNVINERNGKNLYTRDVQKDYVGNDVNVENFFGVLLKDPKLISRGKKVLNSTAEDFVFIYLTSHGRPLAFKFPNGPLKASELKETLDQMKASNLFDKMVIYMESCYSGSMFADDMNPKNNIFAVTSSKEDETSRVPEWVYDYKRKVFLSDEFSITWLKGSDALSIENRKKTLFSQYLDVKNKLEHQTVCAYGDFDLAKEYYTSDFQGTRYEKMENSRRLASDPPRNATPSVPSDEVEFYLTRIHSELNNDDSFERLVSGRRLLNQFMKSLKTKLAAILSVDKDGLLDKNKIENRDCYEELIDHFHENCIQLHVHTFVTRYLYLFVNSCNAIKQSNLRTSVADLTSVISEHCSPFRNTFLSMSKVV